MKRSLSWAYLSGFFDADGSITLKNKESFSPSLNFHNTEYDLIYDIKLFIDEKLKLNGTINYNIPKKENHKVNYTLSYYGIKIIPIIKRMKSNHPNKLHRFIVLEKLKSYISKSDFNIHIREVFYQDKSSSHKVSSISKPSLLAAC